MSSGRVPTLVFENSDMEITRDALFLPQDKQDLSRMVT